MARLKVILLGDGNKPRVREGADRILPWIEARCDAQWFDFQKGDELPDADMGIVLGGDGAILRAARQLGRKQIPMLGVNLGKFGFLAELKMTESEACLEKILAGDFEIEERMMLLCRALRLNKVILESLGLNDAVISRGALSRLFDVAMLVSGGEVSVFRGDGVIVSTPTGSTAHALAAGGPIVHPALDSFQVCPICPHTLTMRPILIPPHEKIVLVIASEAPGVGLTVDGQVYADLQCSDRIEISISDARLKLIRAGVRTFYNTIHDKLGWGGNPRFSPEGSPCGRDRA
ncbi:MAG TPA: NAD(+)/NADH kinase [Candidatus Brocadiia bacterium]|nr:NAD(+)/NADH kinase [Candidatus Brocadiia bacterium]